MPTKIKDSPSGSTAKVKRELIILRYTKKGFEYTKVEGGPDTPNPKTFTGDVGLYYPKKVIEYFNIPFFTATASAPETGISSKDFVTVESFTRDFYNAIDGNAKPVTVKKHIRAKADRSPISQNRRRPAIVKLPDKKTTKGNTRSVTLSFPLIFNGLMISQAVGSMMANAQPDRKPFYWYTEAGNAHRVIYGVTGELPGTDCGAWMTNTFSIAETDEDLTPVVSSAGDRDDTAS